MRGNEKSALPGGPTLCCMHTCSLMMAYDWLGGGVCVWVAVGVCVDTGERVSEGLR